ncbi:polymorphic toxin-type HINT domain-containing protein [Streptomyces sp. AM 4-1-1]|uniref:polymorphic toxin-type HINT domain-containing protein n=1 Tax=Streptomyces sp. AM 4-1-1 TaxID=3028710 RepID=UPI0023B9A45F|nr:polymorphic toxin-type HINT domain-containing protein [Streptomyces sp. AM 4-1-1]WEH32590.1 polymorphic toxin-type HINT domain-containing protein [Streptomyces sp. AM 4-1-1]
MKPISTTSPGIRLLRRASLALSTVMVATLLQAAAAPSAVAENNLPGLPNSEKPVTGSHESTVRPRTLPKGPKIPPVPPEKELPAPFTATVDISGARGTGTKNADGFTPAKGTPIGLAPAPTGGKREAATSASGGDTATRVETRVLDREHTDRAGIKGVLFTLSVLDATAARAERSAAPTSTHVAATVDYSAFARAFGGSYASRMRLVALPPCALTTPDKEDCRSGTPVTTTNDTARQTLTATSLNLRAGTPTVLAATTSAEGDKGTYKATSLAASSTWSTNLNTGDFTWSYDMPTPEVPGGLKPAVGLSYSSASIDGRTGGTNNQGSWVGDGFNLWPGFIERSYKPCADDGQKNADGNKPGDMCWAYDNAVISFNGAGGELIPAGNDEFKLKHDDGTRIKHLASTDRGNGDNDGEYWRLTSPDGTQYFFGYNRLPGWSAGKETTDSTWTLPVYGNNSAEKCHAATFADSWCQQAWRWNLDYVVDVHGNAISYNYTKEANSYGRNLKAEDDTPYTRGGYLKRVDYGLKSSDMYAAKPQAQVVFGNAERCLSQTGVSCAADTIDDKAFYWYDTPWDLNCKAGTKCDNGRLSPSFWTRKRLTDVTTQVLKADGTYAEVDSWKLDHRWGMADTDYQLLLDSVQHTGHSAIPAITLPKTTFAYTQLENRLDRTGDGFAPFVKARLSTVADESGGQIDANYSAPACDWDALPTPETNTTRCFPQYIGGSDTDPAQRHWFNKYVTTSVTATDRTGGSPDQVTRYDYLGGAAWHYDDDDGLTKEKQKTWSQWRGYGQVRVRTGGQGGDSAMRTQQDSYFLRGMDGDRKNTSGGTKSVAVALEAGEGAAITDHETTAGFGYRTVMFDKPGGKVLSKSVSRPWYHETAKKVRDWGTVTANFIGTSASKDWVSLDGGAGVKWRTTSTATKQDTIAGRVVQVDDFGDDATEADDRCTRTTYPEVTATNLLRLPSRVETVTKPCEATADRSKDVLSDIRTGYDGGAPGTAPVKGDATAVATLKSHDGTKATYLESAATYDAYGRQLTTTDLVADVTVTGSGAPVRTARSDGRTTTTAYTPATGQVTQITLTTPRARAADAGSAQTSVTTLDPLRGLAVKQTDTNSNVTEVAYDALGRSTKVWLADRRNTQTPSQEFVYTVAENKAVAIATKTLNNSGGQITSYALYDGFLRDRQTQTPGPDNGTVVTDVFYDERGLTAKTFAPYYTTGKPNTEIFKPADALSVETQTRTTFDGLNRAVETRQIAGNGDGGTLLNTTTTLYGGDRTTVIPPVGGTTTTTLTDARGNTTELRQHHTRAADAPYDTTTYQYTPRGELEKVTDPAGNNWSYVYDQLGRQTRAKDPDKGNTTSTYDDRGQLTFVSGSRTDVPGLAYVYDDLGRQTEIREGSATGALRTQTVYDTVTGAKGRLAQSTRYAGGQAYVSKVTAYDRLYRPTKTAVVIPAAEGKLQGTYQTGTAYLPSGLTGAVSYSAAGSLPGGSSNYTYEDETLRPVAVYGEGMTSSTAYSLTGKPLQYSMGLTTGGKKTQVTNTYEWGTQRLATSRVDREDQPGVDRHVTYAYDEAGAVLSMADVSRTGTDNQCFTHDYLGRLVEAWTQPTTTCATAPAADKIGGPAPYWQTFTYDKAGNRTTETQHNTVGNAAQDTKRTYTYPAPGSAQPHSLTSLATAGPSGTRTDGYAYDPSGNTTARPGQQLTWDAEGHLATVTENGSTTTYLYDADGNRLIGRTSTGTTLYLGHTEVTVPTGATKAKATRLFELGGGQTAIRDDDGAFAFTIADHHGTGELAVAAGNLALTQRRTLPFGAVRGQAPASWPSTKGFVGGTDDTKVTGLTHLGAREYDAGIGRFVSVDPLLDLSDPQQMNGYTYGNNNPATLSDPTGLRPDGPVGGASYNDQRETFGDGLYNARTAGSGYFLDYYGGWSYRHVTHFATSSKSAAAVTVSWSGRAKAKGLTAKDGIDLRVKENKVPDNFYSRYIGPVVGALILPDVDAWAGCFSGSLGQCGWAATDLPLLKVSKPLKLLKGVKRGEEVAEDIEDVASICRKHSFLPGTKVLLADGTTKNIEDVDEGDEVLATDPLTGETASEEVTAKIITKDDKDFTQLTVETGDGRESIIATDTHPFWSIDTHKWIDAGEIEPGTQLRSPGKGAVEVVGIRHFKKQQRTNDLTVDRIHTYYVLAGQTPVLVHNSNCPTASKYEDITSPGARMLNKSTDVGPVDFGKNLEANGWSRTEKGPNLMYEKDGARYFLRGKANSHKGWTADYYNPGSKKADIKIRLGED